MKVLRIFKTALRALRRNVMRAVLTTLGIVIGVGAVIAMMEIGHGTSATIQKTVAAMGADNILVFPGAASSGGVSFGSGSGISLTADDVEAIINNCPAVRNAAPIVRSRTTIVYSGKNWVPNEIFGTTPDYLTVRDWPTLEGELFTERDVRNGSKVCVVGTTIVRELFSNQSPLGQEVRVNNVSFKVIGVLKSKGASTFGSDQDDVLVAPWTTIKNRVSASSMEGQNQSAAAASSSGSSQATVNSTTDLYPSGKIQLYPETSVTEAANYPMPVRFSNIDRITAAAKTPDQVQAAVTQITGVLRDRHRLRADEPDDFTVRNMAELSSGLTQTTSFMTNFLLCVAAISLVVGGVGIMNIMLVSVTERTREIGLRMAVGARKRDILLQFLVESVLLCMIGGATGILLGRGSSSLLKLFLKIPTEVSPGAIIASVIVSASVGVIFGYYPAWKASRLDPIEALRYE